MRAPCGRNPAWVRGHAVRRAAERAKTLWRRLVGLGATVAQLRAPDQTVKTVLLLLGSNIFMTFAWYGHLEFLKGKRLFLVILISWGIAFFEYCLMVPANRIGYGQFTGFQLKIIQEVITLVVFAAFAVTVLKEKIAWNYLASFLFILLAVVFAFGFRTPVNAGQ